MCHSTSTTNTNWQRCLCCSSEVDLGYHSLAFGINCWSRRRLECWRRQSCRVSITLYLRCPTRDSPWPTVSLLYVSWQRCHNFLIAVLISFQKSALWIEDFLKGCDTIFKLHKPKQWAIFFSFISQKPGVMDVYMYIYIYQKNKFWREQSSSSWYFHSTILIRWYVLFQTTLAHKWNRNRRRIINVFCFQFEVIVRAV